jgi:hypothetical protein
VLRSTAKLLLALRRRAFVSVDDDVISRQNGPLHMSSAVNQVIHRGGRRKGVCIMVTSRL